MKWKAATGEHCHDAYFHADMVAKHVMRRVKAGDKPESTIHTMVEEALRIAYQRGVKFGRAQAEHSLSDVIRAKIDNVLGDVAKCARADCPDCSGRGCVECKGTGYFDRREYQR